MKLVIITPEGIIADVAETNITDPADLRHIHVGNHLKSLVSDDYTGKPGDKVELVDHGAFDPTDTTL